MEYTEQAKAIDPTGSTELRPWLVAAQKAWVVLALLAAGIMVASLPGYALFAANNATHGTPVAGSPRLTLALNVVGIVFSLIAALTSLGLAGLLYLRKRDDRMALFLAYFFLLYGIIMAGPLEGLGFLLGFDDASLAAQAVLTVMPLTLIYIFPSGEFVPRWSRWLLLVALGLTPVMVILTVDIGRAYQTVWGVGISIALLLLFLVGFYGQVHRYRHISTSRERLQTKWVVYGLALWLFMISITTVPYTYIMSLPPGTPAPWWTPLASAVWWLTLTILPITFSIAILRHRLWDIDILINRTLVYGALTGIIIGTYVLTVGLLGVIFQAGGNLIVSLLATGLIALLFQPLRVRLQRGVNRLLYGERDDPYAVLTRLNQRLKAVLTPDAVIPTIVETIAQTLKLPYVGVAVVAGGQTRLSAGYGLSPEDKTTLKRLPLVFQNEPIGQLLLATRSADEPFTAGEQQLLVDVAHQVEVAVHAVRLTADLQLSRQRLVTAREEERRRLRRDLHDGLGPALAGLALQADTARELVDSDPDEAKALLAEITGEAQAVLNDIRRLVYNLRPPALDELGLVEAIRQHVNNLPPGGPAVIVEAPDSMPSLPAAVEVAAFRIVQEAVNNAVRHGQAGHCIVRLESGGALMVTVADDGRGLPEPVSTGVGLVSMRERAAELGGSLKIGPGPEGGTRVLARLPLGNRLLPVE